MKWIAGNDRKPDAAPNETILSAKYKGKPFSIIYLTTEGGEWCWCEHTMMRRYGGHKKVTAEDWKYLEWLDESLLLHTGEEKAKGYAPMGETPKEGDEEMIALLKADKEGRYRIKMQEIYHLHKAPGLMQYPERIYKMMQDYAEYFIASLPAERGEEESGLAADNKKYADLVEAMKHIPSPPQPTVTLKDRADAYVKQWDKKQYPDRYLGYIAGATAEQLTVTGKERFPAKYAIGYVDTDPATGDKKPFEKVAECYLYGYAKEIVRYFNQRDEAQPNREYDFNVITWEQPAPIERETKPDTEKVLNQIIKEHQEQMLLEKSYERKEHNGIVYFMVNWNVAIRAMYVFAAHASGKEGEK